jgi:hypothetical protein
MTLQPDETIEIDTAQTAAEEQAPTLQASAEQRSARLSLYGGVALLALGWLVLYLGYNGAATNPSEPAQLPYIISGGFGGMSLILLGGILLLMRIVYAVQANVRSDLRDVAEALHDVAEAVSGMSVGGPVSSNGVVVALRGGSSFHRPGCRLVSDRREVRRLRPEEAVGKGLSPCRVCSP